MKFAACFSLNASSSGRLLVMFTAENEIEHIKTQEVMKRVKFCDVPEENTWRGDFLRELVNVKNNVLILSEEGREVFFEKEELDDIIEYLCTS